MLPIHPTRIMGPWKLGFALDYQTVSSEFIGYNEFGRPEFDTKRTELGDLIYKLKYGGDQSVVPTIIETIVDFIIENKPEVAAIITIPPSRNRHSQPVEQLALSLSQRLAIPFLKGAIVKIKQTPQLKNVYDYQRKLEILKGAFSVRIKLSDGLRILLFDDLYQSGATMASVAETILTSGKDLDIYALTVTRTHKKQ